MYNRKLKYAAHFKGKRNNPKLHVVELINVDFYYDKFKFQFNADYLTKRMPLPFSAVVQL